MGSVDTKDKPADCVGCKSCEEHCPQGIAVSDIMAELAEKIK